MEKKEAWFELSAVFCVFAIVIIVVFLVLNALNSDIQYPNQLKVSFLGHPTINETLNCTMPS